MSATLLLGLLLQGYAVVLLRCRLGRLWLRRPMTILVLASVFYQGLSSVLLLMPSIMEWDIYRNGIQSSTLENATLIMSAGMLAFTIAYLLMKPERAQAAPAGASIPELARVLDWRLLALCCVPLAVLTYAGRGYNGSIGISPTTSTGTVLASTFFVILVALTAFSLVLARGGRWFVPVLIGQSVILAAAGERLPVLADAIVLTMLLCHAGMRPSVRQLRLAAAVAVVAALAVTGVRELGKRGVYEHDSSLGTRVSGLVTGLGALGGPSPQGGPGQLAQAVTRLDGVAFAGAIMQAQSSGQPRLSAAYVPESLLIVVPSVLWPSKLTHVGAVNPVALETADFGLQNINFLPTLPGLYTGFLPAWLLIAFLATLGVLCGAAEAWLFRSHSVPRFVLIAGSTIAALSYEQGLPGMLVAFRPAIAIAAAAAVVGALRNGRMIRRGSVPDQASSRRSQVDLKVGQISLKHQIPKMW